MKSSFSSKTPASLFGIRASPPYFLSLIQRCLCCRDHLSSPYLPAQVICPLLDSWRQRFLSFFECCSTFCATAQQPLVIRHIHSSSSQASFDQKPERIESTTFQFVLWPSVHLSQWLWLPKKRYWNRNLMSYCRQKSAEKYLAFLGQLFPVSPLKLHLIRILSVMVFNIKMRKCQVP